MPRDRVREARSRRDLGAPGHFYSHTDRCAPEALGEPLRRSPAFAGVTLEAPHQVEAFVRQPPMAHQEALVPLLSQAVSIVCGHIRLVRQHPDEYDVRPGLLATFLRRLWRGDERLEYVVLEGEHEESAVVKIVLGREAHARRLELRALR